MKNPTLQSLSRWSQPFPQNISDFPVRQTRRHDEHISIHDHRIRGAHVPVHLPPYPPVHTYKRTIPVNNKKRTHSSQSGPSGDESNRRQKRLLAIKSVEESLIKIESKV